MNVAHLPSPSDVHHLPLRRSGNWFADDPLLKWLVVRYGGSAANTIAAAFDELGDLVPRVIEPAAAIADANPPVLRPYDAQGHRIDEIDFHPAYHTVENTVLGFGLVRAPHVSNWRGLKTPLSRPLAAVMNVLVMEADQAQTGCPLGMMDAMAWALTLNDPVLASRFVPRLTDDKGDHLTAAMFLTEKAGGSDVGANETSAVQADDGNWRLTGEKWFASCPHSDLILTTARVKGGPAGTAGLGLFLIPRLLEDGTRNTIFIRRLKDKFGTRAMPSGEIRLTNTFAFPVGQLDHGMRQMMDMITLARTSLVAAAAGGSLGLTRAAIDYARQRITFGGRLIDHPRQWATLADLVVDATAMTVTACWLAARLEAATQGKENRHLVRVAIPLAKAWATHCAYDVGHRAMEAVGGNGFIEDWGMARIVRDVSVHAIWEGPGNIMDLDVLRATREDHGVAFLTALKDRVGHHTTSPLLGPWARIVDDLLSDAITNAQIIPPDPVTLQRTVGAVTARWTHLLVSTILLEEAALHRAHDGDATLAWIARRFIDRTPYVAPTPPAAHADAILTGHGVTVADLERKPALRS